MKQTVAAYVAKTLEQAGVKRIWGSPVTPLMA